ncbi:MAG TPA: biotin--[acetyl-CoA-carboxylase] ligase [Phycisphaerales bacterium]|nr:MAG: biotin--[acetyl-CoA-carboxylase] ligase [Planctomycetes bacterium GWC2_45_44]HBG77562.1 biotin--[acetyl-CoA-carboxylase] ligase [Phycisphaerales bacterium]HBR19790.1 biotin--[acetyl-CoA-carboxylase] ligase [Phycisphaerales bacterium]
MLDADAIKSNLNAERIGREIIIYKSTSSTNDIAAQYANGGGKNDGVVVLAEQQTAGRGRRANKWLSQTGKSILCSVLIRDNGISSDIIPLVSAVAVAETVGKYADAKIKWPNDIFLADRKVAGILIDGIVRAGQKFYVIGIGINCHQRREDFVGELRDTATSIDIQTGGVCDRNKVAAELLTNLEHYLAAASDNPASIIEKWQSRNMLSGKKITVEYNGERFTGNCIGIEPTEGLIIQLECGVVRTFDAAFTTVVKSF